MRQKLIKLFHCSMILLLPCIIVAQTSSQKDSTEFYELFNLAEAFKAKSKYDSAMHYFTLAHIKGDEIRNESYKAEANRGKALIFLLLGILDSTEFYLNLATQKVLNPEMIEGTQWIDGELVYEVKDDFDSGFYFFNKALQKHQIAGDQHGIAVATFALSLRYKNRNDLEKALEFGWRADSIFNSEANKEYRIKSLINLARIYESLKVADTSILLYKQALELSKPHGMDAFSFICYRELGYIFGMGASGYFEITGYTKQEDLLQEAIFYVNEALNQAIKMNKRKVAAKLYMSLARYHENLHDYKTAIPNLQKAIEILKEFGDKPGLFNAVRNLAQIYIIVGQYQEAENSYLENFNLVKNVNEFNDLLIASWSCNDLIGFYESRGEAGKALQYSIRNTQLWDSAYFARNDQTNEDWVENLLKIRELNELNAIFALKEERATYQRNISLGIGISVGIILIIVAIYFRMKYQKNRIIAAQRIRQLEDEKKILAAQSVIMGQEEERKRIARELHDGIGVLLSTAKIQFSAIHSYDTDALDALTVDMVSKAEKMLDKAGSEVRRISHDMMPGVLMKFGLKEAIEDLFDEIRELSKMDIELTLNCTDERLPENMEITLYRVMQELLNNTIRHAQASRIECSLNRADHLLKIAYSDNGIGFDEINLPHNKSLGLYGIRSRIDFLDGKVTITSEKGKGTSFMISVPVREMQDKN